MTKIDALNELLTLVVYDPMSPSFLSWSRGESVGTLNHDGYYLMRFKGYMFTVHIIIWMLFNGPVPPGKRLDHEDTKKNNNDINNLRLADAYQNAWNVGKYCNNTSGVKGLSFHKTKKKWQGNIMYKGKIHNFSDTDPDVVKQWLIKTRKQLHGNFAHH